MAEEVKKTRIIRSRVDQGWYFSDITEFTQAEKNMIVEWWDWAMMYFINCKKTHPQIPEEVLYDSAVEALMYCVKTWDDSKPASFKNWFHRGFYITVHKYVRRHQRLCKFEISDETEILPTGDQWCNREPGKIKDMEYYGSTQWENEAVGRIDAERILSQLTPRQAEYVKRVYIDGERQADVARSNGVKRQSVEQALGRAKENMRRIINGDVWRDRKALGRPRKHEQAAL